MKKAVVFTAVFGDTDKLRDPIPDPNCDYICFADQKVESQVFDVIRVKREYADAARDARRFKIRPHLCKELANYKYSLWIDASGLLLVQEVFGFAKQILTSAPLALLRHPNNDDIYHETIRCKQAKKENPSLLDEQLAAYQGQGYPENAGLFAGGMILRLNQDPKVIEFNEHWWKEYCSYTRRDQISLNFLLWKLKFTVSEIDQLKWDPPQFKSKYIIFN